VPSEPHSEEEEATAATDSQPTFNSRPETSDGGSSSKTAGAFMRRESSESGDHAEESQASGSEIEDGDSSDSDSEEDNQDGAGSDDLATAKQPGSQGRGSGKTKRPRA
jgi:hypothetical protein